MFGPVSNHVYVLASVDVLRSNNLQVHLYSLGHHTFVIIKLKHSLNLNMFLYIPPMYA